VTSNRFSPRSAPLRLDVSRAFVPFTSISRTELIALNDRLASARRELLGNCEAKSSPSAAFVAYPERMLAEYKESRRESELGRILAAGKGIRELFDRVVIVGGRLELAAVRALFGAACHPYHNELSRGDRGGRPKIYFTGDDFDNDAMQGLIDLLHQNHGLAKSENRWMMIAIGRGDSPEALAAAQCLLAVMHGDGSCTSRAAVAITRSGSPLEQIVSSVDGSNNFELPSGIAAWSSLFTAACLLPASVMGLDVVQLLKGAAAMTARFQAEPPGDNPPLDLAAAAHAVAKHSDDSGAHVPRAAGGRGIRGEGATIATVQSLDAAADWCNRTRSATTGYAIPSLQINLLAESLRRDRLVVPAPSSEEEFDPLALSGKSFAELQSSAFDVRGEDSAHDLQPAVDTVLPSLEENALGQLFQMMMLAAAVELTLT
jgi:glucose-6-phosphate isomerase